MRPAAFLLLLAACGGSPKPAADPADDTAAVYEAFLFDDRGNVSGRVLLQDVTTQRLPGMLDVRADLSGKKASSLSDEVLQALDDLAVRSRTAQPLPAQVRVGRRQTRITADSVHAIFHALRHPDPHRLPGRATVVQLSDVGFSRDRTVAVVYANTVCGSLCGDGAVRVVRKHPRGWVAAEELVYVVY